MSIEKIIADELKQLYPDIKHNLADRYANKYVGAVLKELRQSLLRPENERVEELSFSSKQVNEDCGRLTYNNQKVYLFPFMSKHTSTSLVIERFKGQQGKYKRVILNEKYKEMIMNELMNTPVKLSAKEQQAIDENYNVAIPVDLDSFNNFIEATKQNLLVANEKEYVAKLQSNIIMAQALLGNMEEIDGQTYIKEVWNTSDTGRRYGKHNSLQRINKEVRHAVLGPCYKYDGKAHSFAVMASLAKYLNPDVKIAAIEDYVKYRETYRRRIAKEIGVHENVIKEVFTSMGFGARTVDNPYNSIRQVFYSQAKYDALVNNQTFKYIAEDLEKINEVVLTHFDQLDFDGFNGYRFIGKDAETNRRKSKSKRLAWIYQNAEAMLTGLFIERVRELTGMEPLMTVHDCVYYKQRIPTMTLQDVHDFIRNVNNFCYVEFEKEQVWPITTQQTFDDRFAEQEQAEQEHKQRIYEEERAAKEYTSQLVDTTPVSKITNPFERYTIPKELPDYTEYEYEYEYNYQEGAK
jgi:hypothetical protein